MCYVTQLSHADINIGAGFRKVRSVFTNRCAVPTIQQYTTRNNADVLKQWNFNCLIQ